MTTSEVNKPGIPIEDIIEWQNEEALGLDEAKTKLKAHRSLAGAHLSDSHPSVVYALGEIKGREEVLNSFSAFVITHSADQTGQLDPNLARPADGS